MKTDQASWRAHETVSEFGARIRAWIDENLAVENGSQTASTNDRHRTTQAMYDEGFIGITWPVEYGGRGLSQEYQTEFNRAIADYAGALVRNSVTVGICAATLLDYASEEQKHRHIQRMLRADETWTQLLSEPGAGSDLAAVISRAVLDGDDWVISGQKVWTSLADEADYALALVRTDPDLPRHAGMSMIIVPMRAPGVDVRPLKQMSGDVEFSEVFLDDVRVPKKNLLGPLNGGWAVLSRMLFHERMALSAGTVGGLMGGDPFASFLSLARRRGVAAQPVVRHALGELYMQGQLLHYLGVRMREAALASPGGPPIGSIGKIGIAKLARYSAEVGVLIGGDQVIAWRDADEESALLAKHLLEAPKAGIAGGTTEIQKNVIAERVLGLPRERREVDRPFRSTPNSMSTPA